MSPHKISPKLHRGNFVSPHKISPMLHRGNFMFTHKISPRIIVLIIAGGAIVWLPWYDIRTESTIVFIAGGVLTWHKATTES